jgi:glycosyltransferase involved in cell wall biosynthesis
MNCCLIITTYNWPEALSLVLSSALSQSILPDEIIVADDGSGESTRKALAEFPNTTLTPIIHSWQKDDGFQLAKSRNRAIAVARYEYIIVVDGDMILHKEFIRDHKRVAKKGIYIQGSRALLQKDFSKSILVNNCFKKPSLFSNEAKNKINLFRIPLISMLFSFFKYQNINRIRGCNFSLFKEDIIKVNGFDEDFVTWGKEDSEFVQRLFNNGVLRKNLKFAGLQYHLYHPEGLSNINNIDLLKKTITRKVKKCVNGINKYI